MKILLSLLLLCSCVALGQTKPLQAGAAAVDITPTQFPMNMPGGFSANTATKAHGPFNC